MSRIGRPPVHSPHQPMPPYPQPPHMQSQAHQQNATANQSIDAPLPEGWQKAYTAEGEAYYVNHKNRTTSWFHPSVPQHHHSHSFAGMSRMGQGYPSYSPQPGTMSLHQHLQVDKRHSYDPHHRQEHILQQQPNRMEASRVPATLYNDPYLSSNNHIRQASHDSGLGVTSMPYQSDIGMDFDEGMDIGHSSMGKVTQNRDYLDPMPATDIDTDVLHTDHTMQEPMEGDILGRWV